MSSAPGNVATFIWKIFNYSLNRLENGYHFQSATISTEQYKNSAWYLSLYPKGRLGSNKKYTSIFLDCTDYSIVCDIVHRRNISTKFTFEMIDPSGKTLKCLEGTEAFFDWLFRGVGRDEFLEIAKLEHAMEEWKTDMLEIRCQISDPTYNGQPVVCETHTEVQMTKYLFEWNILIPPEYEDWVEKKKCQLKGGAASFFLTLTAPGDRIQLEIQKSKHLSDIRKLKLSAFSSKGNNICLNFSSLTQSSQLVTSFKKDLLEDKNDLFIKLVCAIYYSGETITSTLVYYSYENMPEKQNMPAENTLEERKIPPLPLLNDLKNLFLSKRHCDAKLQVENEIIPVHKCLLSARSPVFSAMFDGEMLESQTGIINISDVECGVLRSFLEFIYTNTVTNVDCDHLLKLMLVADKYQMDSLKEQCSQILMPKLSVENVCDAIFIADMVNDLNLKLFSLNYMKTNKNLILLSPHWSVLAENHMKLANEILTNLSID